MFAVIGWLVFAIILLVIFFLQWLWRDDIEERKNVERKHGSGFPLRKNKGK